MDTIDKMYIRELHHSWKYYDTLKITELLYLTFLYSYKKSTTDILKELKFTKKEYPEKEQQEMLDNAILILKIKYRIEVIQKAPLEFKKNKIL